jgi:hypothetical protein
MMPEFSFVSMKRDADIAPIMCALSFPGFWGGLTPENGDNETALAELLDAGVLGLKVGTDHRSRINGRLWAVQRDSRRVWRNPQESFEVRGQRSGPAFHRTRKEGLMAHRAVGNSK